MKRIATTGVPAKDQEAYQTRRNIQSDERYTVPTRLVTIEIGWLGGVTEPIGEYQYSVIGGSAILHQSSRVGGRGRGDGSGIGDDNGGDVDDAGNIIQFRNSLIPKGRFVSWGRHIVIETCGELVDDERPYLYLEIDGKYMGHWSWFIPLFGGEEIVKRIDEDYSAKAGGKPLPFRIVIRTSSTTYSCQRPIRTTRTRNVDESSCGCPHPCPSPPRPTPPGMLYGSPPLPYPTSATTTTTTTTATITMKKSSEEKKGDDDDDETIHQNHKI